MFIRSRLAKLTLGFSWMLAGILAITAFLYLPGALGGGFLLDDYRVLPNLSKLNEHFSLDQALVYLNETSGGGPTGRKPVLLTFLMQANAWPNDPVWFKCANLAIHLVNVVLVIIFLRSLVTYVYGGKKSYLFLVTVIGFSWAINSMHVSSVLYVVQRVTLLSSFFTLCALLCFMRLRSIYDSGTFNWNYFVGFCLSAFLALMSKENSIILFGYILLLEIFLFAPNKKPLPTYLYVILSAPLVLLLLYLIGSFHLVHGEYQVRSFTLKERLLTQPRVLFTYVQSLIIPLSYPLGLFHDDFIASKSLLRPVSTLQTAVGWISVVLVSLRYRRLYPWLGLGVCWFLVGHALEASHLPLELYFEHRNYLPSLGVLAILICGIYSVLKKRASLLCNSVLVLWLFLIGMQTGLESYRWADVKRQALHTAKAQPESFRANRNHVRTLLADLDLRSVMVLDQMLDKWPLSPILHLDRLQMSCEYQQVPSPIHFLSPVEVYDKGTLIKPDSFDRYYRLVKLEREGVCSNSIKKQLFYFGQWLLRHKYISKYDIEKTEKMIEQINL